MDTHRRALGETNSYDEVPYGDLAFPQTHPDRLATVGRMFGLATAPAARCRVLELGCGSGGNLIPMAFHLPDARFVGIDLSKGHVDAAAEVIEALELRNIEVRHGPIGGIDRSWGTFDYIICHGVFSWVEPAVQDAILRIAVEHLADHGIAYVSYNTYPGWHLRESVRHMMRYHAGRFDEAAEQIEQARALLTFLASAVDEGGPYGQLLGREIERLGQNSDAYLYHEHLEQTNAPLYFHQFMERAETAGLQYLAEAELSDMLSATLGPAVADTLERISPDLLHLEQYMDFVRNRQFRQTLLCHARVRPRRALHPKSMKGLLLSSRAVTESPPDLAADTPSIFQNGAQRAQVKEPASKAAFAQLMDAWPRAVEVDDLCTEALARAAAFLPEGSVRAARGAMMSDLLRAVMYGMIRLHTSQLPCASQLSDSPQADGLVAYQARRGDVVVNAHHEMVKFEPLAIEVLKLADGRRTRHEILAVLMERATSGGLTLDDDDAPGATSIRVRVERQLEVAWSTLRRSAVLVG